MSARLSAEPTAPDAEAAVVGAVLTDAAALASAGTVLDESDFASRPHRLIFRACVALQDAGASVDVLTVADALDRQGELDAVGGKEGLAELLYAVPTAANVEYHARIVKEHAERRHLIALAHRIEAEAQRGTMSAKEIAAGLSTELVGVATDRGGSGFRPLKSFVWPVMQALEDRASGRSPAGVKTGLRAIDDRAIGFRGGDLIFLAGVPGSGKTALALNILLNAARDGVEGAMVSAEMSAAGLTERCVSNLAMIDSLSLRQGRFTDAEYSRLARVAGVLSGLPLHLDDTARPEIRDVLAKLRHLKTTNPGLGLAVVDFIQLVRCATEDMMALALTTISYDLKGIAKELNIPVIATCQVDAAAVEKGETPKPRLHHLRWSQAMREAGDFIGLVYRESMYDPMGNPGAMEVSFEKARDLPPFVARLQWMGKYMRVEDAPAPMVVAA